MTVNSFSDRSIFFWLCVLVFFFWSFLSIFWSHSPLLSLKAFIGKSLQAGFLFVIVHEALRSVRKVRVFAGFLLFGALIVCLDGLWQSYSGYDFLTFAAE